MTIIKISRARSEAFRIAELAKKADTNGNQRVDDSEMKAGKLTKAEAGKLLGFFGTMVRAGVIGEDGYGREISSFRAAAFKGVNELVKLDTPGGYKKGIGNNDGAVSSDEIFAAKRATKAQRAQPAEQLLGILASAVAVTE
jgi:hypothetical protein